MQRPPQLFLLVASLVSYAAAAVNRQPDGDGQIRVSGELRQWHTVTVQLAGRFAAETDPRPNPYTDYRSRSCSPMSRARPSTPRDDKVHYDCSKLDQWGIVFAHAQLRRVVQSPQRRRAAARRPGPRTQSCARCAID